MEWGEPNDQTRDNDTQTAQGITKYVEDDTANVHRAFTTMGVPVPVPVSVSVGVARISFLRLRVTGFLRWFSNYLRNDWNITLVLFLEHRQRRSCTRRKALRWRFDRYFKEIRFSPFDGIEALTIQGTFGCTVLFSFLDDGLTCLGRVAIEGLY